jgi:NTP pyrophosphatase (non-canonical NTP hydrolase)
LAHLARYVDELERMHGWHKADAARCCFQMGEEVGELFRAVRDTERAPQPLAAPLRAAVGEELVDVLNYLLAIANRYDIDLEAAFREKNDHNQRRSW